MCFQFCVLCFTLSRDIGPQSLVMPFSQRNFEFWAEIGAHKLCLICGQIYHLPILHFVLHPFQRYTQSYNFWGELSRRGINSSPFYNLNLMPSNFFVPIFEERAERNSIYLEWLFEDCNINMASKQPSEFYKNCIKKLISHWQRCIIVNGDYRTEVWIVNLNVN